MPWIPCGRCWRGIGLTRGRAEHRGRRLCRTIARWHGNWGQPVAIGPRRVDAGRVHHFGAAAGRFGLPDSLPPEVRRPAHQRPRGLRRATCCCRTGIPPRWVGRPRFRWGTATSPAFSHRNALPPLLFKGSPLRPAGSSDHAESGYRVDGQALYAESVDVYDKRLNTHDVVWKGFGAVSKCHGDAIGHRPARGLSADAAQLTSAHRRTASWCGP